MAISPAHLQRLTERIGGEWQQHRDADIQAFRENRLSRDYAKARGSDHQFITREFKIGPGGLSLLPVDESQALPVLPFQSYYGLLSHAPTRLSPHQRPSGQG